MGVLSIQVAGRYVTPNRDFILAAKHDPTFSTQKYLASSAAVLAERIWPYLESLEPGFPLLVCPLPSKYRRRFGGQYVAGELAWYLAQELRALLEVDSHGILEVLPVELLRFRLWESGQAGQDGKARRRVRKMELISCVVSPNLLLVDDVITTGSTFRSAVSVFKTRGDFHFLGAALGGVRR
ncbi:hypothetical protein BSR29_06595 [Boudabousia liubingyangii]|uniref:ComF family protein n=1 Tax=Boudabousia liubingyangii TaxID=1921764 RepID=A0A1Q5PKZ8_9ACTO|nr:hypothetical protein BSR29_06595 [Boudabousia liubingyangii]